MSAAPQLPPHWPKGKPYPWPEWERTCPGCGRYTRHFFFVSGELCRCAYCHWMGPMPVTSGGDTAA